MAKKPWIFCIDGAGLTRRCLADSLTVTEAGAVKLWLKGKLVGIAKHGEWVRVYIDAVQAEQGVK